MIWIFIVEVLTNAAAGNTDENNWYRSSFYLLHEDHHTRDQFEVGRDADPQETARLINLSRPDVIQIHAKGNPGWTTYPTGIGFTPPKLARDVMAIWRDIARQEGYRFSTYYNIGRDGEIMNRHPEWNRVKADGKLYERALCYHSGVAEEYLWPMVREIIANYHPDGFWFDGSAFTVSVCYCPKCRERFRAEHDLEPPQKPGSPGWDQYKEMQRQIYREFVHKTAAMIRDIDPGCLVAFNWAYSLRMTEKPDDGIDYLTGDIRNNVDALSGEAHWYDSQNKPFDLMTSVWIRDNNRLEPKPREQIEQEMAIIIANGGRYFVWDAPTPQSGLNTKNMEFLGAVVAPFLRQRQRWCLNSRRVSDVSLLNDSASHYAVSDKSPVCFSKNNNRIEGACDALCRLHLNYEMVPDWRLQKKDIGSPVLIVEHPKVLTGETVQALREYVSSGGILLMTGMGGTRGSDVSELLGVEDVAGPKGPEDFTVSMKGASLRLHHWLYRSELSGAEALLMVEDSMGRQFPLFTRNRFGSGEALYTSVPLFTPHEGCEIPHRLLQFIIDTTISPSQRWVTTDAPETVEAVLRRKGDAYILHLVNRAPGDRSIFTSGRLKETRITNIPPVPVCRISVQLPAQPTAVHLEPGSIPLTDWTFENGRLQAEVPGFAIHQMVVMQVSDVPWRK